MSGLRFAGLWRLNMFEPHNENTTDPIEATMWAVVNATAVALAILCLVSIGSCSLAVRQHLQENER